MSIKSKVLATAAALAITGGVGTAGALTAGVANAATPSAGPTAIDIFSSQFGNYTGPNFVLDVYKQKQAVGQSVILFKASQDDPAEDFQASEEGLVSDFYAAGLVSAAVALHYGGLGTIPGAVDSKGNPVHFPNDVADEIEYTPFGVGSGLCVGVATPAATGTKVSLQQCGVSSKTIWIQDTIDSSMFAAGTPLINGSDSNFSHPFALTYPNSGFPTDKPRPELLTENLTGFTGTNGVSVLGSVSDKQLWEAVHGVLP